MEKRAWTETALYVGAAFLLFQVSLLFFLFAVPLFLLGLKQGQRAFSYGAAAVTAAVLIQTVFRSAGISEGAVRWFFFVLEAGYPTALVIGIAAVLWERGRSLAGMLKGTVLVALLSFPVVAVFTGSEAVTSFLEEQVTLIVEGLRESFAQGGAAQGSNFLSGTNTRELVSFIGQVYIRNYLFGFFLLLSASWAIARALYARMAGIEGFSLRRFQVPEKLLWPFLIGWAGVLIDALAGIPVIGFVFWNAALILLFLYGLHGIGVLKTLFRRYGVGAGLRIAVTVAAVIILLTPRLNLVLIIGVPLLGISEYWVRYREREGTS
jgi:hypothetical protein